MIEVFGINSDVATHFPDEPGWQVAISADGGFTAARAPLWLKLGDANKRYFDALKDAGLQPLAVLHRDAFTAGEWDGGRYRDRIAWWREQLGDGIEWEAGNETEPGAGSSSSTMTKSRWAQLIRETRAAVGSDRVISGGLVSGNPYYVLDTASGLQQAITECCDGFGNHLYEETLPPHNGPFPDRRLDYWLGAAVEVAGKLGKHIDITEIGFGDSFYGNDQARVADAFDYIINALLADVRSIYPFCQEKIMVPNYGMRDGGAVFRSWDICSGYASALKQHRGRFVGMITLPDATRAVVGTSVPAAGGATVDIETLATKPQRAAADHPYGMWGLPAGIKGVNTRTVWADTPDYQLIIGTPGPDGQEEAVVIDSKGLYRPND